MPQDPLSAVLGLYNTLVRVLARPASVDALMAEALQVTTGALGATGGAVVVWAPGKSEPAMAAGYGVLEGFCVGQLPCDLGGVAGVRAPEMLSALAAEWGEVAALACGLSLLGATSWLSHRGEYALAFLVGPRSGSDSWWRQEALAAATGLVAHAVERMLLGSEITARLAQRDARWSSLYEIGVEFTRVTDSDKLLDGLVQRAIHLLHARRGSLSVVDEVTGESVVTVAYQDGATDDAMIGRRVARFEGTSAQVMRLGPAALVPEYEFVPQAKSSIIRVPLFVQHKQAGVLAVGDDPGTRHFTEDDVQTMELLAHTAGAILEQARGRSQDETLTVHRERARLARDLHYGLAQTLASLLMKAELCHDLARRGSPSVMAELDHLASGLQRAIRETRSTIFSLRDEASDSGGLIDALQLLAGGFEMQSGRTVDVTWEGDRDCSLSPSQHTALLAVLREALANVRKHAAATRVCVHLNTACPEGIELIVQDDGKGFNPDELDESGACFGILGMAERIQELHGNFRIGTADGTGTIVRVTLPLAGGDQRSGQHQRPHYR